MFSSPRHTYTPAIRRRSVWSSEIFMAHCYKKYEIETCAANVTKQDFPPLIAQLFDISFQKDHIKGGFKKSGIYPLDRSIFPQHKFDKGIPFVGPSNKNTTPQEQGAAEGVCILQTVNLTQQVI